MVTQAQKARIKNLFAQPTNAITPSGSAVTVVESVGISAPVCIKVEIRIAKLAAIKTTLIHVRCADHKSGFFAADQALVRPRFVLINSAAIGRPPIPRKEASPCRE